MNTFNIFILFFKIGTVLLGGGYVVLPILQSELVEKRKLLSFDQLLEFYSLSQCLPGIIVINTTIFVGYKIKGFIGALSATFGIILPAFFSILIIATFINKFIYKILSLNDIFFAISISVAFLIFMTFNEIFKAALIDKSSYIIFLYALVSLLYFKISPINIIIISAILGIIINYLKDSRKKE